ncbi:hypothetical protein ASPZODRAFT_148100 [Neofusicoccum parvum]|uniref:Uncharacterized protein n=1 Tax=Neofusicoccum parvum TaxID=310453 RepID=A0ACB5S0N6_9PEZI|nr:hypothetical protein ASPZODRAFT_148100 [Neofusicoccum parvum]
MARHQISPESLADILKHDTKVKVAGIDADGVLRGKVMSKSKFLSVAAKGFGMSSAIFGWDMHDQTYDTGNSITSEELGFGDFMAVADLSSYRKTPWEDALPFFLVDFYDKSKRVPACPRGLLKSVLSQLAEGGAHARAGVELEFLNYISPNPQGTVRSGHIASFLQENPPSKLLTLTDGMFGYSVTRTTMNKTYFHSIFDQSKLFDCELEGWHTESGPGVFEAALQASPADEMADKVSLFKYCVKSLAAEQGITPCFMAKPSEHLPGNSGHIHLSFSDGEGNNLFARDDLDQSASWPDIQGISDLGRYFLAGLLEALPDIMPLLAPTINSYKRLVPNYWAPTHVSWGLENRMASIRLVAPPVCSASNTRFEIRIAGADLHPHYALAALIAAGWRGVKHSGVLAVVVGKCE